MTEQTNHQAGYLEQEIAELSRQIEEKRRELEASNAIVSDREVVAEVVAEQWNEDSAATEPEGVVSDFVPNTASTTTSSQTPQTDDSYLNTLDDQSTSAVNALIALVPERGIKHAVKEAKKQSPFVLDAFHDALVDRLYDELQARGIVS